MAAGRLDHPGTVDALLADARHSGDPATERMIADWIAKGLLDHPQRRSKGRGRGSDKAIFSPNQRQLFTLLLSKHRTTRRISDLAVFPIGIWVYWGDDYVPLDQAKRALYTHVQATWQTPKDRAEAVAKQTVEQIRHPDATPAAVSRLTRRLTDIAWSGHIDDPAKLVSDMRAVADPGNTGRLLGPSGVAVSPEEIVTAGLRREAGAQAILQYGVLDDCLLAARLELCTSVRDYLATHWHYAGLTSDRAFTVAFENEGLIRNVVSDLRLIIGAKLMPWPPEDAR